MTHQWCYYTDMYVPTFRMFCALFMVHWSRGDSGREEIGKLGGIAYSGLARRLALLPWYYCSKMSNVTVGFAGEKD